MMSWLPVATTIENEVVYACANMEELQWLTESYFNIIPKVFSLTEKEIQNLRARNFEFRIRYQGHRNVYLEEISRKTETIDLTKLIMMKHKLFLLFKGRLEHGWHKAKSLMPELDSIYKQKYKEAIDILAFRDSPFRQDGLVLDYALETGMDIEYAAKLIQVKHENAMTHSRKLERLRLRHMSAIKKANTLEELEIIHAAIDKDLFTNMLL
jgi:hypothetical protein